MGFYAGTIWAWIHGYALDLLSFAFSLYMPQYGMDRWRMEGVSRGYIKVYAMRRLSDYRPIVKSKNRNIITLHLTFCYGQR